VEVVLVWTGVVLLAVTAAAWAKYVMDRNSVEERTPRIGPPAVLTALLAVVVVAIAVMSDGSTST
jgi:hypothetical protein